MFITLRDLNPADLNAVVSVHFAAFPDSALTKLGKEAVRRYYEWQMVGPHDAIHIGALDHDTLVGFCFGGIFRGALGGFLEKNQAFLTRQLILHPWLLLNPLFRDRAKFAILRLYRHFYPQRSKADVVNISPPPARAPSFGILSIAVTPQYQGSGAAKLLMEHAEHIAVARGFTRMGLTVHPGNERAVRFYEKTGWLRDEVDGNWTGPMSKEIGLKK